MRFEWDERKRWSNLNRHGLDFLDAVEVFDSPHIVVPSAHGGDVLRFLAVGLLQGRYVTVIFTNRGESVRGISFRRARHEERQAHSQLFGG